MFGEREEQLLHAELLEHRRERVGMVEVHGRAECGLEFATIGLEHRGAAVREEVAVLGIHDHRDSPGGGALDRALDHRDHQHALVVILEDHGIGIGHRAIDGGEQRLHFGSGAVGHHLLVDAQQLLRAREHAGLGGGGARGLHQAARVAAERGDELQQPQPRGVVAHHGHQLDAGTDGGDVLHDIGRTAEGVLALAHVDHRHRRLGGDAIDVAAQVDVEHGVSDDGNAKFGGTLEQNGQAGAVHKWVYGWGCGVRGFGGGGEWRWWR